MRRLRAVTSYEDPAAIFPTHLGGGIIRAHAERGLCAMLSPASDGTVPEERETGKGGGIVVLAAASASEFAAMKEELKACKEELKGCKVEIAAQKSEIAALKAV